VRFLEDFRVKIRHISVGVWVCLDCFVRFRHLPDYIEAYKRYVKPTQMALARRYLLRLWGYRMTAEAGRGSPQVYEKRNMSFVHATVWRWVGEFGDRLQELLIDLASQNIQLELQKSEGFPRWKFQSEPRLALLNDSFQALEIFQRIETGDHLEA